MKITIVDFETRSRVDLKRRGAFNYASDLSTDILCCAFKRYGTGREWLWYPHSGELNDELFAHLCEPGLLLAAHNAQFDQLIWEYAAVNEYGFPEMKKEQWYCTAAQARVNNLPDKLENTMRALDGKLRKNFDGMRLIKLLSIPNANGEFNEDAAELQNMGEYCLDDVRATYELIRSTRLMTQTEHEDWLIGETINNRGVRIDRELATAAMRYAGAEIQEISEQITELTDGAITKPTQTQRIRECVLDVLPKDHPVIDMMKVYKDGGQKWTLDRSTRDNILTGADAEEFEIPEYLYELILLADEGSRSSVSKFTAMVDRADDIDDRVRGAFIHAGAGQTHRFASRGLQLHNMRRDCYHTSKAELYRSWMMSGARLADENSDDGVMDVLSKMLRPALIPADGHVFIIGDWSAIEAMVLPWLANAQDYLDMFRRGEGVYEKAAADIGIEHRQAGKVVTLACGFGGGVGAISVMAKAYKLPLTEGAKQQSVVRWRQHNAWAVRFWKQLSNAAMWAVKHPGEPSPVRHLTYTYVDGLVDGTLLCQLPGGTTLHYPRCRIERDEFGPHLTAMKASYKPKADAKEWPRGKLWHGVLAENATQAFAAAILRHALRQTATSCVAHVHDELVLEVPESEAEDTLLGLSKIMNTPPDWARGLPLKAKPYIATRYGK